MTKSRLYTRTGDDGTTSLVGGKRMAKTAPRLEAYGTLDELNSWIGLLAAENAESPLLAPLLTSINNKMFNIGSYLATDPESEYAPMTANPIANADIDAIEEAIDRIDAELPPLTSFVLPGGTVAAAHAHIARSVCRRCERRVLAVEPNVDPAVLVYINRLSDLLFAIARFLVIKSGADEIFWSKDC